MVWKDWAKLGSVPCVIQFSASEMLGIIRQGTQTGGGSFVSPFNNLRVGVELF